jgi:hypothetical protein
MTSTATSGGEGHVNSESCLIHLWGSPGVYGQNVDQVPPSNRSCNPNMSDQIYSGLEHETNRYGMALLATWREALAKGASIEYVPFSKEDFVRHGAELRRRRIVDCELDVKNIADIIYTYRARCDLPAEILAKGNYAIIGRGKGLYAFSRIDRPNRITLPGNMQVQQIDDVIPSWIHPYLNDDEQGMLTTVNANNLVTKYLGLKRCFRIQSHLRMGVLNYGQVEIDDIYIGEFLDGKHVGIAVEAKDYAASDCLNVSQLFGASKAVQQVFPSISQVLLGVKPTLAGEICMCSFAISQSPNEITETRDWACYKLVRKA